MVVVPVPEDLAGDVSRKNRKLTAVRKTGDFGQGEGARHFVDREKHAEGLTCDDRARDPGADGQSCDSDIPSGARPLGHAVSVLRPRIVGHEHSMTGGSR